MSCANTSNYSTYFKSDINVSKKYKQIPRSYHVAVKPKLENFQTNNEIAKFLKAVINNIKLQKSSGHLVQL